VRYHNTPTIGLCQLCGLNRFGNGTDLIDLKEETIARLLLNGSLDPQWVRHRQIITNDLDSARLREMRPSLPIVLLKRILNADNGVLLNIAQIQISQFDTRDPLSRVRVGILEVEVVFSIFVKFGRGNVEGNFNLAFVTGFF